MSRKDDITERNPIVFIKSRYFKEERIKHRAIRAEFKAATFITGRNGPQNQEWADHLKPTYPRNVSVLNASSLIGPTKFVGGRQAITVLLAFCCSLYPKLAEINLLMPSNEPSIVALTLT